MRKRFLLQCKDRRDKNSLRTSSQEKSEQSLGSEAQKNASKKDYIAIARILKNSETIPEVKRKIADYFALDNPRFNRERFMQTQFNPERKEK